MRRTSLLLPALAVALTACSDPSPGPETRTESLNASIANPSAGGTSVYWNRVARDLVGKYRSNAFEAIRGYAILSVAQYNGIIAAAKASPDGAEASARAAVSGASAVALTYLYPTEAAALEALVVALGKSSGGPHDDAAEAAGRAAAERIVARARNDNFFEPWTGTVPVGPGLWFSSAIPPLPPLGARFGQARTFLLRSGAQFRPPPPPAFGSPQFVSALAEVRRISDTRTEEQLASAVFWAFPAGTYTPGGYWNAEASRLAVQYDLREIESAHLLALMNMVGFDAIVASHDAKFTYWSIRPTQADPDITLAIGLPNFPSYPSNHASLSSSMATILGSRFPAEKARLDALAQQAALSRLFGGIHYRFDCVTGLRLGRMVAEWGLQHDVVGQRPFLFD